MSAAHTIGPDSSLSDIVVTDTPPISPVSTSPYIPISECISGHPRCETRLENFQAILQNNLSVDMYEQGMYDSRFYDSPRQLRNNRTNRAPESYSNVHINNHTPPLQSPTDSENVFMDESIVGPNHDSLSLDIVTAEKLNKLSVDEAPSAPPRPPKPSHLGPAPNYFNLPNNSSAATPTISTLPRDTKDATNNEKSNGDDGLSSYSNGETAAAPADFGNETYDFPRSHQIETGPESNKRHCYNNAAPSFGNGLAFQYDVSPQKPQQLNQIFKYDPDAIAAVQASPVSHSSPHSSQPSHSNLPSPLGDPQHVLMPPPVVLRNLKPKRKLSDSPSVTSEPQSPFLAPSVDRKLKPSHIMMQGLGKKLGDGEDTFGGKNRKIRAAPSPTPPGTARSHDNLFDAEQMTLYDNAILSTNSMRRNNDLTILQYLDLDLDKDKDISLSGSVANLQPPKEVLTVYKTVDFVKTEAIKRTRQNVEEERKQCNKDT